MSAKLGVGGLSDREHEALGKGFVIGFLFGGPMVGVITAACFLAVVGNDRVKLDGLRNEVVERGYAEKLITMDGQEVMIWKE